MSLIIQPAVSTAEEEALLSPIFEAGEVDEFGLDHNPVLLPEFAGLEEEWDAEALRRLDEYRADPSIGLTDEQVGEELARRRMQRAAR